VSKGTLRLLPLVGLLSLFSASIAEAEETAASSAKADQVGPDEAAPPQVPASQTLGAISVAHPHAGFLINGVRMPKDNRWVISAPQHAYGTEETIAGIEHCVQRVRDQFPMTPPVMLGSISPKGGGAAPPHISHRTGRDADVYFFRQTGAKWYQAAKEIDTDLPRTWAMLKCFITEVDVDFVLIDKLPQSWLEQYALSIGEEPAWVNEIFHGVGRYPQPVIKHVPGHVAHMHVRFVSPIARERGRFAYESLVQQGHISVPSKELVHEVIKGDSLSQIAEQYKTTVDELTKLNKLESNVIKVGQKLTIKQRVDLRAALDPIVIPPRHSPPQKSETQAPRVNAQAPATSPSPRSSPVTNFLGAP
jgi:LysM repeat protein